MKVDRSRVVNRAIESDQSFTRGFLPDEDVIEDLCSLLTLLSRRLITPVGKIRERHPSGIDGLGSYGEDVPIPIMGHSKVAIWKRRPGTIITTVEQQNYILNDPPPVGVDDDALSDVLRKLPTFKSAEKIVDASRLYRTALELIESRPDIAYQLLISTVETLATVAQVRPLDSIMPAPENDNVYNAIAWDDPGICELTRSIKEHGLQEPILISSDGFIISGHRRRMAAQLAELELVPVRVHRLSRTENPEEFIKLLVEMNSQRIKSTSELLHESLIKVDPKEAHQQIVNERKEKDEDRSLNDLTTIDPYHDGSRCEISQAKQPFLVAILRILNEQRKYWPLSDRQVHYRLLGPDAPLTHASKPDSKYVNDKPSYRKLTDLLSRGRITGLIPWGAIEDVTRPVDEHKAFANTAQFLRQELKNFLKGYWRSLQQSQPHHIEIVAEKLTVQNILDPVAQEYTIPLTITRGMSSLPPKKQIRDRYRFSRKEKLILLVVSDLDPAGDAIAEDLVKSLRRDFGIHQVEAYKVALTIDQVDELSLEPSMEAKDTSPTYQAFVDKYGITDAYELEAMDPGDLAEALESAIDDVLDIDLYNQELAAEEDDSAQIIAVQKQVAQFCQSLNIPNLNPRLTPDRWRLPPQRRRGRNTTGPFLLMVSVLITRGEAVIII